MNDFQIQILFGSDSGALDDRCLAEIHQRTLALPDERAFLIVPEQNKVQMERAYLNATGAGGLLMAEVLSFRRLAHRLLDEAGLLPDRRVDEFGRRMLIFRVLKEKGGQLHSFAHLADRSGFIAEAESVIGDLKRHQISAEQLRQVAVTDTDKALSDKCHDLSVLLEGYDQALTDQVLSDSDDDLNRLADLLDTLSLHADGTGNARPFPLDRLFPLQKTHVSVNGFGFTRDFTPQEYRILERLSHICASMTITIQADAWPVSEAAAEMGPEQFLIARRTLRRLSARIGQTEPVHVDPTHTALQSHAAGALTIRSAGLHEPIQSATTQVVAAAPAVPREALTFVRLTSAADEIDWIAGEIRQLTQTGQYRYQDIAIALCEPATALPLLRSASRRYQLPFFLDEARSLEGTALLRFMLGLLDLSQRNWSRDAVMAVLRSGLTTLTPEEIDLLENDLLQRGLFRKDRLFGFASLSGRAADETAESDRRILQAVEVFMPMRLLTDDLRKAPTAADCSRRLRRYFTDQQMASRISSRADHLKAQGETDAALLLISAHTVLGQVLQQLETIAGNLPMNITQLRDTIRSGLAGASITLIPSALDQIMVGDWRRICRQPCRVLFVVGARADVLPPRPSPEGILKDLDRQRLSDLLQIRLPSNVRDQAFADSGSLFQLVTRAADRLYLCSSGGEEADLNQQIAAVIPEHREIVSDDRTDLFNRRLNALPAAWHGAALLSGSAVALPADVAAVWRELVRQIAAKPEFAASPSFNACRLTKSQAITQPAPEGPDAASICLLPGFISPEIVRQLYAPLPSMSVSQLEKYAACPFSHLAAYILRLQERAVYAPESADTGTLLHRIVEIAMLDLCAQLTASGADPEGQRQVLAHFASTILPGYCAALMDQAIIQERLTVLKDPGIRSGIGRKLKKIAECSLNAMIGQLEAGGFLPQYLEWHFGPDLGAAFAIRLPDGQLLNLRGMIDRVDICTGSDSNLFRVIDYKSGDKKVDPDALYHGLALQLPAYLAAFSANHPEAVADEVAYFHFDWPIVRPAKANEERAVIEKNLRKRFDLRKTGLSRQEIQLLQQHTLGKMEVLSGQLFDGRFPVSPRKIRGADAACRYCTYSAVCGFNRKDFCFLPPIGKLLFAPGERLNRKQVLCRLMAAETGQAVSP